MNEKARENQRDLRLLHLTIGSRSKWCGQQRELGKGSSHGLAGTWGVPPPPQAASLSRKPKGSQREWARAEGGQTVH